MEDHAAGPEPSGVGPDYTDPSLKERLEQLEKEAAALREAMGAPPDIEAKPEPQPEEELVPATAEQIEQAENLLRQARLARTRNQMSQAADLMKQAEAVAPTAPNVLEFIGDDFVARSQFSKARELYGKALKLAPKNVGLERKYAETVLKSSNIGFTSAYAEYEAVANAKAALLLNIFFPGVGHVVVGEIIKGVVILLAWIAFWIWANAVPNGIEGLLALAGVRAPKSGQVHLNSMVFVPIALAFITHVGAIIDMSTKTKREPKIMIEHPKPPADLPFE